MGPDVMAIDLVSLGAFVLAATLLLGSPGPGIAALVAVGRSAGFARGLRFYAGLQLGLALAAAVSVAGLLSLVEAVPGAGRVLAAAAAAYLIYLAWRIASAPVGEPEGAAQAPATALGGFVLGVANPKAYVAFVSLAAAYVLVRANAPADAALKWTVCVAVAILVDLAWLWFGGLLGRARLRPGPERALNFVMGAAIVATTLASFV